MRALFARARARVERGALPQSRSRGVRYADPLHAGRHPFQTYLMIVAVVSSFPILFGVGTARSVTYTLPPWLALAWGLALLGGSGCALVGSFWLGDYADALTIERVGLYAVGAAATVYSPTILLFAVASSPPPATLAVATLSVVIPGPVVAMLSVAIPTGLTLGLGLSSLRRARDIGQVIHSAIANIEVEAAGKRLELP